MTQIELAKKGKISSELKTVAKIEKVSLKYLQKQVAKGTVVIPCNKTRTQTKKTKFKITGIGRGLRTKVNANIGTSPDRVSLEKEKEKLKIAIAAGADAVMDLSTGGNLTKIRQMVIKNSTVPIGTVPIYQVACQTVARGKKIYQMDPEEIFEVIEKQAQEGVDFVTVHCGVTKKSLAALKKHKRTCGIVSRGGAFHSEWIIANGKENPLYKDFDRLLEIAYKYDLTLSLGDGLRPGCLEDASDQAQISELKILGELTLRARAKNVQVMIEGPGHMPLNQVQSHVKLAKKLGHDAPYYVLGPLVTDVAAGYDHITCAIGGAIASAAGVDFLCYVTPSEHIRLPDKEDVYSGVIASRIAAHAGDIVKNVNGAREWDKKLSLARKKLDWKKQKRLVLDPAKFYKERKKSTPSNSEVCTMCGKYCAMREMNKILH